MSDSPTSPDFESSELGTKSYWDNFYQREITNFADLGDIGEKWFGEDAVDRMVDWVENNVDPDQSIVDLGCGNGHVLLELATLGYKHLAGVDYSEQAITLAQSIAEKESKSFISYEAVDILSNDAWLDKACYNVVLDKGTYDAISLHPDQHDEGNGPTPTERYVESVHRMIHPKQGLFLITSCNWTMQELCTSFQHCFRYHSHVKYPTFSFGGHSGSKICTVAFEPL